MKVLNLYSGIGGNRKLWKGVEVTAVEIDPQIASIYMSNFLNDKMIIGDAHRYLLENFENFDFIWSSPPCQSHSTMMIATRHKVRKYPDMELYQQIIFLRQFFKGKFVVENVKPYYEPLIKPNKILDRHYFWCNYHVGDFELEKYSDLMRSDVESIKKWLGFEVNTRVYYRGNHNPAQIYNNCVHPKIGLHFLEESKREANIFRPI